MDALTALQTRVSAPRVTDEPLSEEVLENLLKAAIRAPDHALVRPWRFIVLQGQQREELGKVYEQATREASPEATPEMLEKAATRLLRAPVVIVAVAEVTENHKVPVIEQIVSTGAAVSQMMVAAYAMGVGAMWRTGPMASCLQIKQALGFADKDEVVGFIYLGTPAGKLKSLPNESTTDFVREFGVDE